MFQTRTPSRHHVYGDHLTPAINLLNDKTLIQVHPICFIESILIIVQWAALPIFDSSGYLLFYYGCENIAIRRGEAANNYNNNGGWCVMQYRARK